MLKVQCRLDHVHGKIDLPSSKSLSNRILMIHALSHSSFQIHNLSDSTDTMILQNILYRSFENEGLNIVDVQDAGTPFRFLTAYFSIQKGKRFFLTGTPRMCQRPIAPLVDALCQLGAKIHYANENGFPPLIIDGTDLHSADLEIDSSLSSQFVSALCLLAPLLPQGLKIFFKNQIVSFSYIEMTLSMMKEYGAKITQTPNSIAIANGSYKDVDFIVENDWSSACFFYAMAMIQQDASIRFENLFIDSAQGDKEIINIASYFGIQTQFENNIVEIRKTIQAINIPNRIHLSSFPDLAIPFIVACAIRYPYVKMSGLTHLHYKESDRLFVLQKELKKVQIYLHFHSDVLEIDASSYQKNDKTIFIQTFDDHRIAMSLSLLALDGFTIILDNPNCVKKSFPNYFDELKKIGFCLEPFS